MKCRFLASLLAVGLAVSLFAETRKNDYPQISFVAPGSSKTSVNRDQFVILVVEGPFISHEKTPVPYEGAVGFVNDLLKARGVTYVGVHIPRV